MNLKSGLNYEGKTAKKHINPAALAALLLAAVMAFSSFTFVTASDSYPDREGDFSIPGTGEVLMGLEGEFVKVDNDAKARLLARVNEIRKEACDEGVPSPDDRTVPLTSADYVPLKWSRLVELVAAMRAAESSVYVGHGRLASNSSVFNNGYGAVTHGENLAWNMLDASVEGILYGIEQWYEEKADWINNNTDAQTGHYTSMIDPGMRYIGLSGFYSSAGKYRLTVTNHLSAASGLDESVAGLGGPVTQKTLVKLSYLTGFSINGKTIVKPGETVELENTAVITAQASGIGDRLSYGRGPLFTGISWNSDNPSVASVDSMGNVTAHVEGRAVITASVNGTQLSDSVTVDVIPANVDPDIRLSGASITLSNDLSVNFKVPSAPFRSSDAAASDPFLKIMFRGEEITLTEYKNEGSVYSFSFKDIAPHYMNENIEATLYATVGENTIPTSRVDYSIVKYCKNLLAALSDSTVDAALKKLLVDTLTYGSSAQEYMNYNVDSLAVSALTPAELAYGSEGGTVSFTQVINSSYRTVASPLVTWETFGLYLDYGINVRMKVSAESVNGLSLFVTDNGEYSRTVPASKFEAIGNNEYYVTFEGLNPSLLRTVLYAVFMQDGNAVSNTFRFSVNSYFYTLISDENVDWATYNLVWSLVFYGDSAQEYVEAAAA
ncbi:MAG: Ig-like domain-containing protein [Clostridia bacterium]|nr:Ig-like domain-containing protein [Clostridia bacterium]